MTSFRHSTNIRNASLAICTQIAVFSDCVGCFNCCEIVVGRLWMSWRWNNHHNLSRLVSLGNGTTSVAAVSRWQFNFDNLPKSWFRPTTVQRSGRAGGRTNGRVDGRACCLGRRAGGRAGWTGERTGGRAGGRADEREGGRAGGRASERAGEREGGEVLRVKRYPNDPDNSWHGCGPVRVASCLTWQHQAMFWHYSLCAPPLPLCSPTPSVLIHSLCARSLPAGATLELLLEDSFTMKQYKGQL